MSILYLNKLGVYIIINKCGTRTFNIPINMCLLDNLCLQICLSKRGMYIYAWNIVYGALFGTPPKILFEAVLSFITHNNKYDIFLQIAWYTILLSNKVINLHFDAIVYGTFNWLHFEIKKVNYERGKMGQNAKWKHEHKFQNDLSSLMICYNIKIDT